MQGLQTVFYTMLITWGAVTVILIGALIYRSTLETHEDDQIFLAAAGDAMANEQRALVTRIEKLNRPITSLYVVSGVLLLATGGLWVYQVIGTF